MLDLLDKWCNKLLILCWEPSENVLCYYDCLLHSDRLTVLNDLLDYLDSSSNRSVDLEDDLSNSFNSSSDKIHVHIIGVVLQLDEHILSVLVICHLHKDLYLL